MSNNNPKELDLSSAPYPVLQGLLVYLVKKAGGRVSASLDDIMAQKEEMGEAGTNTFYLEYSEDGSADLVLRKLTDEEIQKLDAQDAAIAAALAGTKDAEAPEVPVAEAPILPGPGSTQD